MKLNNNFLIRSSIISENICWMTTDGRFLVENCQLNNKFEFSYIFLKYFIIALNAGLKIVLKMASE